MFTGLIQGVGVITRSQIVGRDLTLSISADCLDYESISVGDSIAVDGVCLTVVETSPVGVRFDVSAETIGCTLLGRRVVGDRINVEQSLLPNTRMGGHFVSGHVDGVGVLLSVEEIGQSIKLRIKIPQQLERFIARKGCICVDGVSLTVNSVLADEFEVNIVPHTTHATTIGYYRAGQSVHIEVDLIARYVDRILNAELPQTAAVEEITREFLTDQGFNAPNIDV